MHNQLARWTFKRSLLKCLEAAVLTTSEHRCEGYTLLGDSLRHIAPPPRPHPTSSRGGGRDCRRRAARWLPPSARQQAQAWPLTLRPARSLPRSKEILALDGVGVIVRSCRWRPDDATYRPKQEVRRSAVQAATQLPPIPTLAALEAWSLQAWRAAWPAWQPALGVMVTSSPPAPFHTFPAGPASARQPGLCARHRRQRLLLPLHCQPEPW